MKTPEEKKAYLKEYRKTHVEEIKKQKKINYDKNKDDIKIHNKLYYEQNKENIIAQRNEHSKINKDNVLKQQRVSCKKYRDKNKDKERARTKAYRDANAEKCKNTGIKYRELHKDEKKEYGKKYRETHKEQERLRQNKYYSTPAGILKNIQRNHKRRDARKATVCDLTFEQWNTVIAEQNNRCAHCGREFTTELIPTQDHIIPVSKGGGLTYENVQALCKSCNSRKRDRFECDLPYLKKRETVTTTTTVTKVTDWFVDDPSEEQP